MKEVVYGYSNEERNISYDITPINYVSEASAIGTTEGRIYKNSMPEMWKTSKDYDNFGR